MLQMLKDSLRWHRPQIELQTARKYGDRHLLRIRGCKHKLQIVRWLFQGFEHGIEGMPRQHMHLVNHEDLKASLHRLVNRLFQQRLHLVNTPVGCRIELGVVHKTTRINFSTGRTHTTRRGGYAALPVSTLAIERFGQNPGHRGLTYAPGTGKKIGVVQALRRERVA